MLLYKPDWEETQQRFAAWWAGEYFGRCAIAVTAPRADAAGAQPPPTPDRLEDRWLDHEYLRAWNEHWMRATFFGGEAVPVWKPGGYPGWAFHPCFLGAEVTLDEATGWVHPILGEGRLADYDPRKLVLRPENRWWRMAREMMRLAVRECKDKAIPSIGAFGGSGDTLAALRGTEQLLYDVADSPECVREFDLYLMRQWTEIYTTLYGIMREEGEGSTCWCELWSPGKFYASQNDFSYMLSTRTYRDVFLPSLQLQTEFLDHSVFHVDGVAAFAHLDMLFELPRLQAFQIIPGAGKPSPLHYLDVLKKVQAAGKNLQLYLAAEEVRPALENLSARGLFIFTCCATEEEARALLRTCEQLSQDR